MLMGIEYFEYLSQIHQTSTIVLARVSRLSRTILPARFISLSLICELTGHGHGHRSCSLFLPFGWWWFVIVGGCCVGHGTCSFAFPFLWHIHTTHSHYRLSHTISSISPVPCVHLVRRLCSISTQHQAQAQSTKHKVPSLGMSPIVRHSLSWWSLFISEWVTVDYFSFIWAQ